MFDVKTNIAYIPIEEDINFDDNQVFKEYIMNSDFSRYLIQNKKLYLKARYIDDDKYQSIVMTNVLDIITDTETGLKAIKIELPEGIILLDDTTCKFHVDCANDPMTYMKAYFTMDVPYSIMYKIEQYRKDIS